MNRPGIPKSDTDYDRLRKQQMSQLTNSMREFPLSVHMFFASLVFWIILTYTGFKGIQYFAVHRQLNDTDLFVECPAKFGATIEENIAVVEAYTKGESAPYLKRLGSQKFTDTFQGDEAPAELTEIPPIVTAVSSADFYNVQQLIEQVDSVAPKKDIKLKLIIYDVGLYSKEASLIKKHCKVCEFRTFEWSVYPDHVADTLSRAWIPIIIQVTLEEFGSAIWIDPSVQLKNVQNLKQFKYRVKRDFYLWEYPIYTAINAYTSPKMFTYLNEKRCSYIDLGMMDVNSVVLYRTKQTWFGIMKPWLKCALTKDCIAPKGARRTECFHYKRPKSTGCHWFEQSIFSILINRVFQFTQHLDKFKIPRIIIEEPTEIVYYFPEQPWTYTQLFFLVTVPGIVIFGLWYWKMRRSYNKKVTFYNR